jgi:putative spermidine/putrescine transport system substrate-binding protein
MSRVWKLLASVVAGVLVVACGAPAPAAGGGSGGGASNGPLTPAQAKGRTLTIQGWGGVWTDATKAFADKFGEEYGVTIQYPSAPNPGTAIHLEVQSGTVQSDVVDTASYVNYKQGDLATFPSWLVDTMKQNMGSQDVTDYVIDGYGTTATIIACNPDMIKKCPTNAKEFWDVDNFPGPRAITGTLSPDAQMLFALMAAGTPKEQLYPIDLNKAVDSLKLIKPNIRVWPGSGGQMQQVLIDKEVGIIFAWNGRMFTVQQKNIPNLQMYWDDSTVSKGGGLAVVKGAPNADLAFTFLNWWVQQAELQAKWSETLTYPTPNKKVASLLPKPILDALPAGDHPKPVVIDPEWSFQNQDALKQAFQQFLTGQ